MAQNPSGCESSCGLNPTVPTYLPTYLSIYLSIDYCIYLPVYACVTVCIYDESSIYSIASRLDMCVNWLSVCSRRLLLLKAAECFPAGH